MTFAVCLPIILEAEGLYVNNPKDPGGATMKGITQSVYDNYRDSHGLARQSVQLISDAELNDIYNVQYWKPSGAALCAPGLDLMVFDTSVNMGVGRAVLLLQSAVGVKPDGKIGPATTTAIQAASPVDTIGKISAARDALYHSFSTFPTFGNGWMHRLAKITGLSISMATA